MDGLPRRLAVIVLIVLLALLLPSHGTHARAPSSFFGVSLGSPDINGVDLSRMHHARVKEAHWTLFWPGIEAVNDHFNWSGPDRLIGKLASKGIRLMPVLYGSPSYAAPTQQTPPLGSASAKNEWSEFVRYAVLHYGPGGTYWTNGYRQKYPGHRAKPI